jgi:hypothetical protein
MTYPTVTIAIQHEDWFEAVTECNIRKTTLEDIMFNLLQQKETV